MLVKTVPCEENKDSLTFTLIFFFQKTKNKFLNPELWRILQNAAIQADLIILVMHHTITYHRKDEWPETYGE